MMHILDKYIQEHVAPVVDELRGDDLKAANLLDEKLSQIKSFGELKGLVCHPSEGIGDTAWYVNSLTYFLDSLHTKAKTPRTTVRKKASRKRKNGRASKRK